MSRSIRVALLCTTCLFSILARAAEPLVHAKPAADFKPTAAYRWLEVSLEATAREVDRVGARPTIISRTLAVAMTAMYDAWAAYDAKAVGTRLGSSLRRPPSERTDKNREIAIAYATYRALVDVYPDDKTWLAEQMRAMGFDPDDNTIDLAKPQGVGNVAAKAVCDFRHHDGANQLGDEVGSNGKPYSDYTFYAPVNAPGKINDPDRWQPLPFSDKKGGYFYPGFLTPHWYRVRTFALDRADQFRPPAPPKVGSDEMKKEVDEVIRFNATLTAEQKATVEFMRDGPRSTGQSGHWLRFAEDVSRRDKQTLDQDVKLFFSVANVAMDAFIACWEAKRYYDSVRPWTLVREYYGDKEIEGWTGPGKGVGKIKGDAWHPYSPDTFITPPFPGYVSGHSTVSAACSKLLELFTGSDTFGFVERRKAGTLTEPDAECPQCDVELPLPTFSATAEMAGISRVMGGYHIQADNIEGLALGRKVAAFEWPRMQAYFDGTAK
ncbi:MAG TPA: vanadium-dependent haloperoxidase [Thermoanaerobaculia bacterium]|nr:vanadium-dependent haloperoxidase [Thermoanaerobaculia bacterium]